MNTLNEKCEKTINQELVKLAKKFIKSGQFKNKKNTVFSYIGKYILFSPSLNSSLYGISYESLGLTKPHHYKKFINKVKKELKLDNSNYYYLGSSKMTNNIYDSFKEHMKNKSLFIAFRANSKANMQLDSLIRSIRNGFAHGSFILIDRTFVIWNFDNNITKALIVISASRLDKLIKLFTPPNHQVLC